MLLNGRIGQVLGPFDNHDLLAPGGAIEVFTPETTHPTLTKLGIQTTAERVIINGITIKIGYTGIYELDSSVAVNSLIFPDGADADTIVDFVY